MDSSTAAVSVHLWVSWLPTLGPGVVPVVTRHITTGNLVTPYRVTFYGCYCPFRPPWTGASHRLAANPRIFRSRRGRGAGGALGTGIAWGIRDGPQSHPRRLCVLGQLSPDPPSPHPLLLVGVDSFAGLAVGVAGGEGLLHRRPIRIDPSPVVPAVAIRWHADLGEFQARASWDFLPGSNGWQSSSGPPANQSRATPARDFSSSRFQREIDPANVRTPCRSELRAVFLAHMRGLPG